MHLVGHISLDTDEGMLLADKRVRLLEAIERHGSIQKAAKEIGLSYKAAWDAVNAMNNLYDQALVQRDVGGRRGGGSSVTEHGRHLIKLFNAIESEYQQVLDHFGQDLSKMRSYHRLLNRFSMKTSARNQFRGVITALIQGAVSQEVRLRLDDNNEIIALVTNESADSMELRIGMEVFALVKATSVLLYCDNRHQISCSNQLWGEVDNLQEGPMNTEVTIALSGDKSVTAVVTQDSCKKLGIALGKNVCAGFNANSVILAIVG
jgi:molybdate transport system regulatory protein